MKKMGYDKEKTAYSRKGIRTLLAVITMVIMTIAVSGTAFAKEFNQAVLAQDNVNVDSIHTINIIKDVTAIEDGIFAQFKNLERINVDDANPYYASYDGCLYNKDYTRLICIPQGKKSVYVRTTITSIAPHALDGLPQERIDKVNKLVGHNTASSSTPATTSSSTSQTKPSTSSSTPQTKPSTSSNSGGNTGEGSGSKSKITYNYNNPSKGSAGDAVREVIKPNNNSFVNKNDYGNTNMSKYVYTYAGHKYFMYTGSGVKDLYVPEGVEVIYRLSATGTVNTDIETIHLPSTIGSFGFSSWLSNLGDKNEYSALQQCTNLKSVTGGSDNVTTTGSRVYMTNKSGGQTLIWQRGSKIKYNESAFY